MSGILDRVMGTGPEGTGGMGLGILERVRSVVGGTNGTTTNGTGSPLADIRTRIQERITAMRSGTTTTTPQMGKLMAQFPRVAKLRRTGGVLGNLGLGKRIGKQNARSPGHRQQNISPTAQVPAIADDIYSERLRAESSPGLSVSI